MRIFTRVAIGVGVLAVGAILLIGFVPFSEPPQSGGPGAAEVNCGSVFAPAEWNQNDNCERENTGRGIAMLLAGVLAVPFLVAAGALNVVRWIRSP